MEHGPLRSRHCWLEGHCTERRGSRPRAVPQTRRRRRQHAARQFQRRSGVDRGPEYHGGRERPCSDARRARGLPGRYRVGYARLLRQPDQRRQPALEPDGSAWHRHLQSQLPGQRLGRRQRHLRPCRGRLHAGGGWHQRPHAGICLSPARPGQCGCHHAGRVGYRKPDARPRDRCLQIRRVGRAALLFQQHAQRRRRHLLASAGPVRAGAAGPELRGQRHRHQHPALCRYVYLASGRALLRRGQPQLRIHRAAGAGWQPDHGAGHPHRRRDHAGRPGPAVPVCAGRRQHAAVRLPAEQRQFQLEPGRTARNRSVGPFLLWLRLGPHRGHDGAPAGCRQLHADRGRRRRQRRRLRLPPA